METLLLHTTRGVLNPETLKEARTMHNAFVTEGPHPGIEIARLPLLMNWTWFRLSDAAGCKLILK